MTRFRSPDVTADRFCRSPDAAAVAEVQLFGGRIARVADAPDLTPADADARYRASADIERGARTEIRQRDRPGPTPPGRPHPRPRTDLRPRPGALARPVPAPEGKGPGRQPAHRARSGRAIRRHQARNCDRTTGGPVPGMAGSTGAGAATSGPALFRAERVSRASIARILRQRAGWPASRRRTVPARAASRPAAGGAASARPGAAAPPLTGVPTGEESGSDPATARPGGSSRTCPGASMPSGR